MRPHEPQVQLLGQLGLLAPPHLVWLQDQLSRGVAADPVGVLEAHGRLNETQAAELRRRAEVAPPPVAETYDETPTLLGPPPEALTAPAPARPAASKPSGRPEPKDATRSFEERFEDRGELGRGGMGVVRRVFDHELRREVAIKLIRADLQDATLLERFRREMHLTARLEHPSVPPVHEAGRDPEGRAYMVLRLVDGETLRARLESLDTKSARRGARRALLEVLIKVGEAIAFAHDRGVVHRDLKPENIMLGRFGEVFVMDWGIARDLEESEATDAERRALTPSLSDADLARSESFGLEKAHGPMVGSPGYMSPQQVLGQDAGPEADVFALGLLLTECLGGAPAIAGESALNRIAATLSGRIAGPRELDPDSPAELDSLARRATARKRYDRLEDAALFVSELRRYLSGALLESHPYSLSERAARHARRHATLLTSAGLALSLGLGATLLVRAQLDAARLETERQTAEARLRTDEAQAAAQRAAEARREAAAARQSEQQTSRLAEQQRRLADRNARAAAQLADRVRLPELLAERTELWPAHNRVAPRIEAWLEEASALLARRPAYREALTRKGSAILDLSARGPPPPERLKEHVALQAMLEQLTRLEDALPDLERRLARARSSLARSITDHAEAWARARAAAGAPRYGELDLEPREGLVPLGPDPASGLEEFALLATGRPPTRDASGILILDQESAAALVLVPPGRFLMGEAKGHPNERPVREVTIPRAFLIGKHELTKEQWARVMGPRSPAGRVPCEPVDQASWKECQELCLRAGCTLPPERFWEYAARAGATTRWSCGDDPRGLASIANGADQALARVTKAPHAEAWADGWARLAPIGQLRANAFGLHDTSGNVWERCRDVYTDSPQSKDAPPSSGARSHVVRSSSWNSDASRLRCAKRLKNTNDERSAACGLRLFMRLD